MATIGRRIRERRIALGLSVDELAARLGKNRATVYRYESDEIENFPISIIVPLANALQTTPGYLMGWESNSGADEYSDRFRSNLSLVLGQLDGFTSDDVEAMQDYHQLEELAEKSHPLSLAEACDAAEKVGESVSYLLQDDIGNPDRETEKAPIPETEDGREVEVKRLFDALSEEGKASALNYLRYLAANADSQ